MNQFGWLLIQAALLSSIVSDGDAGSFADDGTSANSEREYAEHSLFGDSEASKFTYKKCRKQPCLWN